MARCETCDNEYDKPLHITYGDAQHTFDSFECAIHLLAPACAQCGCRIIGHGVEADSTLYCCASCAEHAGEPRLVDRVEASGGGGRSSG